jgi:hypothetical protein
MYSPHDVHQKDELKKKKATLLEGIEKRLDFTGSLSEDVSNMHVGEEDP